MFYVKFYTGAGDASAKTLPEAKRIADENAGFTQDNISIYDENKTLVASRIWYGSMDDIEETRDPIRFGSSGFYGDWTDEAA